MFAVVEIGGSQYRVEQNSTIEVDKLKEEPGNSLSFDKVLLIASSDKEAKIGQPYVSGAKVEAKVVEHTKGKKVTVFKMIPKKRHSKKQGHRQKYTKIEITKISG